MKIFRDKVFCFLLLTGLVSGFIAFEELGRKEKDFTAAPKQILGYETEEQDPRAHLDRAYDLMEFRDPKKPFRYKQDLLESIRECEVALKLKPEYPDAYITRAFAKHYLNQFEESKADLDLAIVLDPNDGRKYATRAVMSGLPIDDINKAITVDPTQAFFFQLRGSSKCRQKDYIGALVDFAESVKLKRETFLDCAESCWYHIRTADLESEKPYYLL